MIGMAEISSVFASIGLEGANAALAQNHVVIAAGMMYSRRQQQLFESGRNAALEQTGFLTLPNSRSRLKFCILRAPTCRMST